MYLRQLDGKPRLELEMLPKVLGTTDIDNISDELFQDLIM